MNDNTNPAATSGDAPADLEFTATVDRMLGKWAEAAEGGVTSHEIIREKIIDYIRTASGATASGDELPSLSDFDYQEILGPVLSREGMRRYRNGDPLNLDPSDLRAMIDRASAAVSAATKPTADEPLLRQWQQFHSAMSQCAELLDNMSDGESLFDTPKFLAAKLASLAPISAPLDLNSLTRYSMWSNSAAHGCDPSQHGRWVEFADVQSLLATKPAGVPTLNPNGGMRALRQSPQIAEKVELLPHEFKVAYQEHYIHPPEDNSPHADRCRLWWDKGIAASRRTAAGVPREPTQAMKEAAYLYREQMYAQEPPQAPTIPGYWIAMFDATTPAPASAGQAAPALPRELADAEIVEVLASLGTDAEKSVYDWNPVLQVRTTVPAIRQIVAAYLKRAAQPAEGAGQAGQVAKPEPTTIVQDVAALFRACGFDVREEPSALDPKGEFAIAGSLDAGGLLVESVIEHCENLRLAGAARQGGATQPSTAPTERATAPASGDISQSAPIAHDAHSEKAAAASAACKACDAKQAKIDALMLEYCPAEMTAKQMAEWERHQRAAATSAGEQ